MAGSPCYNYTAPSDYMILQVVPDSLMEMAAPGAVPPVGTPAPALKASDVVDPPLPEVSEVKASTPVAAPTSLHSGWPSTMMINAPLLLF